MRSNETLRDISRLVRHHIISSTTAAGSGHPTSSLSATDIMTVLMFGGFFEADLENPKNPDNDRLIFSKGHAAPLLYSLYTALGKISYDKLLTLRQFYSNLEGHPTMRWEYTEAATGSLGQGLGVGLGMALAAKMDNRKYKTFVLMGDSEMAEGSVWEAMMLADHYKLDNIIGIVDVNRLGQRGETMFGHHLEQYKAKAEAFGWETFVIDGHDLEQIKNALRAATGKGACFTIIEKSLKTGAFDKLDQFGSVLTDSESEKWGKIVKVFPANNAAFVDFLKDSLISGPWYSDDWVFSKTVIYPGKIFVIKDDKALKECREYGLSLNIPLEQLDFDTIHSKPKMIITKTLKGAGISFIEDKEGWHGKALSPEDAQKALLELGDINPKQIFSLK